GLVAATSHLGRPLYAFRAFLNLRRSWLSREIIAFGAFPALAFAAAAAPFGPAWLAPWKGALEYAAVAAGFVGVFCSAMIYAFTKRPQWTLVGVNAKFFLTTAWLGAAVAAAIDVAFGEAGAAKALASVAVAAGLAKLCVDGAAFLHLTDGRHTPLYRTARLMIGPLVVSTVFRFAAGAVSVAAPYTVMQPTAVESPLFFALAAVVAAFVGEAIERTQFFLTAVAPSMPGGIRG
ncbi:MAG: dimethyl sulfoxide reductase anchor subunit family protein, partial [Planctomycetia bacterium]